MFSQRAIRIDIKLNEAIKIKNMHFLKDRRPSMTAKYTTLTCTLLALLLVQFSYCLRNVILHHLDQTNNTTYVHSIEPTCIHFFQKFNYTDHRKFMQKTLSLTPNSLLRLRITPPRIQFCLINNLHNNVEDITENDGSCYDIWFECQCQQVFSGEWSGSVASSTASHFIYVMENGKVTITVIVQVSFLSLIFSGDLVCWQK